MIRILKKSLVSVIIGVGFSLIISVPSYAAYFNFSGFETGNTSEAFSTVGTVNVQNTNVRTGTYSLRINPSNSNNRYYLTAQTNGSVSFLDRTATTYYVFYLKMAALPTSGYQTIFGIDNLHGQSVADVRMDSNGDVYINGVTGSDTAGRFTAGGAYRKVSVICASNSTCSLSVDDGSAVSVIANATTQDRMFFGSFNGTYDAYFDDVVISDAPIRGNGQVKMLVPNANGTTSEWSLNTSTFYQAVNEVPHNGDATILINPYRPSLINLNLSPATGVIDGGIESIKAVAISRDENQPTGLQLGIEDVTGFGSSSMSVDSPTSYGAIAKIADYNPNGGGKWSQSVLDNARVFLNSFSNTSINVTAVYLMVLSTNTATGVEGSAPTNLNSYYATLNGSANPNGNATTVHFRVFKTNPSNCNIDSGGIRYPELSKNDISLGNGTSVQSFSYTIPFTSAAFLQSNTPYWYCSYAVNTIGTVGSSSVTAFTTPDGPSHPCDAPTSGNLVTIANASCTFDGSYGGVDQGAGTSNTATLTLGAGTQVTLNPNQQVAISGQPIKGVGSTVHMAHGTTFASNGIFVHDKDRDGIIDSRTQYITNPPANATEFVRRNTLSSTYNYAWKFLSTANEIDCDPNNANVYRTAPVALVIDADNDGYITSAAPATGLCVGASSVINGRTYYRNSTGAYAYLPDSQKLSSTPDCFDDSARPCRPINVAAVPGSDSTSLVVSWEPGVGPAPTSYNIRECSGSGCTPATAAVATNVTSPYTRTGRLCGTVYRYQIVAVNGNIPAPNSTGSTEIGEATTGICASAPTVITDPVTGIAATSAILNSTVNPNNSTTGITYRYQTTSTSTCNSSTPTSTLAGPSGLTGSSPLTGSTTQATLGGLTAGTRYYYCATAANSINTTYGSVLNFYTVPNAPTSPTAVKVGNQKAVTVSWTAPSGTKTGYKIYWCSGSSCTPSTGSVIDTFSTATSYVHNNASFTCGGVIRYQVLAYNLGGDGDLSSIASATLTSGSNVTCYQDSDSDNYAPSGASTAVLCGSCTSGYTATQPTTTGSTGNTDCYDSNSNARPGQTSYFGASRGDGSFDYNCDNTATKQSRTWCSGGAGNTSGYYMSGVCTGTIYTACISPTTSTPSAACGTGIYTPLVSTIYYTTSSCSTAANEAVASNVTCR